MESLWEWGGPLRGPFWFPTASSNTRTSTHRNETHSWSRVYRTKRGNLSTNKLYQSKFPPFWILAHHTPVATLRWHPASYLRPLHSTSSSKQKKFWANSNKALEHSLVTPKYKYKRIVFINSLRVWSMFFSAHVWSFRKTFNSFPSVISALQSKLTIKTLYMEKYFQNDSLSIL